LKAVIRISQDNIRENKMKPIQLVCFVVLCFFPSVVSSDIARFKSNTVVSPKTGAIVSNAGQLNQHVPIRMPEADVKIRFHLNDDATIQAVVSCIFQLQLVKSNDAKEVTFITAFPISQVRSPYLELQKFSVTVDGEHPPMIIRKTVTKDVYDGRMDFLVDEKVYGTFPQELGVLPVVQQLKTLEVSKRKWEEEFRDYTKIQRRPPSYASIELADGSRWEFCYLWVSSIRPNQRQRVVVEYKVTLAPQPNERKIIKAASKSPGPAQFEMPNTLPEHFHRQVGSGTFYFFSYILRSGAAWSGPIGREEIELLADKGIDLSQSIFSGPRPVETADNRLLWKIINQKPTEDLLIAIPAAVPKRQEEKNKDNGKQK
jgi:hypothetical protein